MWKLIILTSFIWNSVCTRQKGFVFLIMDDCRNWRTVPNTLLRYDSDFIYSKGLPNNHWVSLSQLWNESKPKPITKKFVYLDITKPIYASELSYEDWWALKSKKVKVRIFILKPKDYCSTNRFAYGHQFTLYEVNLDLSSSHNDLIDEIIIHPIPAVDNLRREKNNWR